MRKKDRRPFVNLWLVAVLMFLILFSGCTKQRAKMALDRAKKVATEAEQQEAEKYKPELLQETRTRIDDANNQYNQRNYSRALEIAKQAVEQANETLENTKIERASDKLNQAKQSIDIANTNDGSTQDPERYKRIQELFEEAQERNTKNKWDDVIELSNEVISEVEILLQRLKNQAERDLTDAQNALNSLEAEGAEQYAPEAIIEVKDLVNKVETLIRENKDYISAQNTAQYAIRKAAEGITKTKERKSQEKIKKIESDLALAITKGAEIYARDMLEKVNTTFEAMIRDYFSKNFDRVLMTSPLLESSVAELLETTKRKAAEARIKAVEQTITELIDGGAKQYLPGRVEVLEQNLTEAKEKYDQKEYEEAETICLLALDEGEKIRSDFNDLALDAMRNATEALNIAQDVFEQMEHIFITEPLSTMSPVEREFENAKETLKTELETSVQNARLNIEIAQLRQENGEYRRSIEISGEVRKAAEAILQETYHVVAHNAIMELAQNISNYERDGGREYAPRELEKTRELLQESKDILAQNRYKEAVNKAAEARAQMEVMVQEIHKTAVGYLQEAKERLADADKYQATKYKKADLLKTQELLNQAEAQLQGQELKPAVEKAFAASDLIKSALMESTKLWAQEELSTAEAKILRAQEAGAGDYAPESLDQARKLHDSAQQLLEEGSFLEAKDLAEKSSEISDRALYKKINEAENLITEAKSYGGWDREFELLSQSLENARKSRELIEQRDYISSRLYAKQAIKQAQSALVESKIKTFNDRTGQIRKTLQVSMNKGMNYFEPEGSKDIIARIGKLESEFDVARYDYYRKELDKIDADLNMYLSSVPEALNSIIEEEEARLNQIEPEFETINPEKIEEARRLLKYTRIDFEKDQYAKAYRQLKEADEMVNKMETIIADERYMAQVSQMLDELDSVMDEFRQMLSISPEMILRVATDPQGQARMLSISTTLGPGQFREKTSTLYEKAARINAPGTKKNLHEAFLKTLNNARLAGIDFEKLLILEEYTKSEARHVIERAFSLIEAAKEDKEEIRTFITQQERKVRAYSAGISS